MEYWFWPILRLLAGLITVLGSSGLRAVLAENLILKQQLLVMRRSRRRAPNLRTADRFLFVGKAIATGCLNCQSPLEGQFAMYTTWYVGVMRQGYD